MAPRSRRSAATELVEEEEEQEGVRRLRFKHSLISKPGKQVGVTELLSRLKALCDELQDIAQEEADTESLTPSAKELAHHSLIQHKDAGVRAWTACCLVDMFRLFAPNAPYSGSQLKDIFTLMVVKILPLLADPSHPYNSQHLYMLKSLADFKSIVIITDIPGSGHLTNSLFTTCFDVLSGPSRAASGEELSKNVEHHMTGILSILIDEAPVISSDVVDVIVAQFLWADPITLGGSGKGKKSIPIDTKQSTLRRKEAPPAYNMAKNLCNAYPEKMARLFGTYFGSVIVDFASGPSKHRNRAGSVDDLDEDARGPSEEDINDASKAHRLLRELWRCAPGALQEIIPHLQEELGTENVQLRQLATETFGDMIAGIGAAGPPPQPDLDPTTYPSQSLSPSTSTRTYNYLTTPASLNSFPSQYPAVYQSFLSRQSDKSPVIRASWTTGIARIIMTSAGGVGLNPDEEQRLLKSFARCLIDSDDRVRLAAIKAIEFYEFDDILQKLGSDGSMAEPGSILSNLADRIKDRKPAIHAAAIKLLGRIWGVAAGAIAEGDSRITDLLGPIPSKIMDACYVRDSGITAQVDTTLYEALLPLSYPPMKPRGAINGGSQVVKDGQARAEQDFTEAELDKIRAERQLVLVRGLEEKAKKVFFASQGNQVLHVSYMELLLKLCEKYNGGVMDKGEKEIKAKLDNLISYFGKTLPDSYRAVDDLWKFANAHDRRSYQLIRFCMAPESDYRKIVKSIKELRKRIEEKIPSPTLFDTMTPLLYRVSLLCFNKSHVPAIIEYTRTDEKGLGATAHEILKEISTKHPKVFSMHVSDLCKTLEKEAPTQKTPNPPGAVDDLKACASFAKKFPNDIPLNGKDNRKLVQSLLSFALHGTPAKAAKHAVTIIMSSDDKKEVHAMEIFKKSEKGFTYGCDHWLTKLAALSQLVLLAPPDHDGFEDRPVTLAVEEVLLKGHPITPEAKEEWMEIPDDDMSARKWALSILVNRLLSCKTDTDITEMAAPVFTLLNRMIKDGGEASKKKNTPLAHKNRQRLLAANFMLKLACQRRLDSQIKSADFVQLAMVTHDECPQVRKGFAMKLMKYLGQNRLPSRYYTILLLYAHEPDLGLRDVLMTWIRSRRAVFTSRKETLLETSVFARLLSLIAHHPDFDSDEKTLKEMSTYIIHYLKCVATEDNLALIYHMAGRIKTVRDGVDPAGQKDYNLYIVSDLAQTIILLWEEENGWSMQTFPGKQRVPGDIFKPLESHERGQEIAQKQYLNKDLAEVLPSIVRKAIKGKKRKPKDGTEKARKKVKQEKAKGERAIKTPRKKRRIDGSDDEDGKEGAGAPLSGPRRKSGRQSTNKSYLEVSSEDEDTRAGAEENEQMSDAESEEGDVEMEESPEPELVEESEPEPEPEPPKAARGKGTKKTNGVKSSPVAQRHKPAQPVEGSSPAKATRTVKSSAKGKGKVNGTANITSSSPAPSDTIRRSGRTRR